MYLLKEDIHVDTMPAWIKSLKIIFMLEIIQNAGEVSCKEVPISFTTGGKMGESICPTKGTK